MFLGNSQKILYKIAMYCILGESGKCSMFWLKYTHDEQPQEQSGGRGLLNVFIINIYIGAIHLIHKVGIDVRLIIVDLFSGIAAALLEGSPKQSPQTPSLICKYLSAEICYNLNIIHGQTSGQNIELLKVLVLQESKIDENVDAHGGARV